MGHVTHDDVDRTSCASLFNNFTSVFDFFFFFARCTGGSVVAIVDEWLPVKLFQWNVWEGGV